MKSADREQAGKVARELLTLSILLHTSLLATPLAGGQPVEEMPHYLQGMALGEVLSDLRMHIRSRCRKGKQLANEFTKYETQALIAQAMYMSKQMADEVQHLMFTEPQGTEVYDKLKHTLRLVEPLGVALKQLEKETMKWRD